MIPEGNPNRQACQESAFRLEMTVLMLSFHLWSGLRLLLVRKFKAIVVIAHSLSRYQRDQVELSTYSFLSYLSGATTHTCNLCSWNKIAVNAAKWIWCLSRCSCAPEHPNRIIWCSRSRETVLHHMNKLTWSNHSCQLWPLNKIG